MDPEVVKAFLLGDYCLHGGTGWWKYEFCYGKSARFVRWNVLFAVLLSLVADGFDQLI